MNDGNEQGYDEQWAVLALVFFDMSHAAVQGKLTAVIKPTQSILYVQLPIAPDQRTVTGMILLQFGRRRGGGGKRPK